MSNRFGSHATALAVLALALAIGYAAKSCGAQSNVKRCAPLENAASKFIKGRIERAIERKLDGGANQERRRPSDSSGLFGLGLLPQLAHERDGRSEEKIADRRVLLVFTYKNAGICPACDRARPVLQRLAKEYPVEFYYWESAQGQAQAQSRGVRLLPTFVQVARDSNGRERELQRWSGAYDVERKIRGAFDAQKR